MAEAGVSDKFAQVRGFKVDISNASGNEVDTAWESVSSGEMLVAKTNSPGHKSVGEITLRGAMTDKRAALCTWINETVNGKPSKRTITITPINVDGSIGETHIFTECALTAYRLPHLPAEDTEELRFAYASWTVKP